MVPEYRGCCPFFRGEHRSMRRSLDPFVFSPAGRIWGRAVDKLFDFLVLTSAWKKVR
jgi:hypothetical protein